MTSKQAAKRSVGRVAATSGTQRTGSNSPLDTEPRAEVKRFLRGPVYPWEAGSHPVGRVQKRRQALALYSLSLTRHQIQQILGIKSRTVGSYLLALTIPAGSTRMLEEHAEKSLVIALERAYGLGEHVEEWFLRFPCPCFFADAGEFLRRFRGHEPTLHRMMWKLRRILKTPIRPQGRYFYLRGRNGCVVKVRVPRTNRYRDPNIR
jgi:hypothetical protein